MSLDFVSGPTVVIDCGSGVIKAGFAGDDNPKVHLPCIVGIPKHMGNWWRLPNAKCIQPPVMGLEIINKRGAYKLEYPINNGDVRDWSAMVNIYDHLLTYEMKLDISNHLILFTEPFLSAKKNRELMAEIFFEKLNCPGLFATYQSILSLYASGRVHGLILDSGESITCVVPVYDTFDIRSSIRRQNLAGKHVTEHLIRLLTETGIRLFSSAEHEIAREIKENCCFVAVNYQENIEAIQNDLSMKESFKLPDGQMLHLTNERFRAPEILFNPSLCGSNYVGLNDLINETLFNCDLNIRTILANNILLTGGNTMFRGFPERLLSDVEFTTPKSFNLSIRAPINRQNQNWIGGSILADRKSVV